MDNEIWKEIDGHKNYYVSNYGRIKSEGKEGFNPTTKNHFKFHPVILKPSLTNWGYLRVVLQYNHTRKHMRVHRLVAEAFLLNIENKPEVNHIDGNKLNNHVDNLEWVTAKENHHHAVNTGLKPKHINPTGINQYSKNKNNLN